MQLKTCQSSDPHNVCGQLFQNINYIKNRNHTRLTDDSLQSCMKMTAYSSHVRIDALNWDARAKITLSLIAFTTFTNVMHDSYFY